MSGDELQDEARRVLELREPEIVDGRLDDDHWLRRLVTVGRQVLRRERTWRARRDVRDS